MMQDIEPKIIDAEVDNLANMRRLRKLRRKEAVGNKMVRITVPKTIDDRLQIALLRIDSAENPSLKKLLNDNTAEALVSFNQEYVLRHKTYPGVKVNKSVTLDPEIKILLTESCKSLQVVGNTQAKKYTKLCCDILSWWLNKNGEI